MNEYSITKVSGTPIVVRGNDIDTDRIIPARFLKRITFEGLGEHAFNDDRVLARQGGHTHPFDAPHNRQATILLVNKNFGCGSSREAAPQALYRWGIRAVIGESFGEIFYNNSIAVGMPCVKVDQGSIEALQRLAMETPTMQIDVDLQARQIRAADAVFTLGIGEGPRRQFIEGYWDATVALLANRSQIEQIARTLPYIAEW